MNSTKRVLYRADGGHPIGMGHILRALRLSKLLGQIASVEITLVTRENKASVQLAKESNLPYLSLEILPPGPGKIIPRFEFEPVKEIVSRLQPDLIVVDMLDTNGPDMSALASVTDAKLATFDNRGEGRRFADLIINFLVRDPDPAELKSGAVLLEGPAYATLAEEFDGAGKSRRENEPEIARKVLVTVGGADAAGLAVKAAKSLALVPEVEEVVFAVGLAFPWKPQLDEVLAKAPWKGTVKRHVESLLPLFLDADIAIVAGGLTMHESACCGVPSIATAQPIDHQLLVAEWLEEAGAMINLGYGEQLSEEKLAETVSNLARDKDQRERMSKLGRMAVDGRGTKRVAEALAELL